MRYLLDTRTPIPPDRRSWALRALESLVANGARANSAIFSELTLEEVEKLPHWGQTMRILHNYGTLDTRDATGRTFLHHLVWTEDLPFIKKVSSFAPNLIFVTHSLSFAVQVMRLYPLAHVASNDGTTPLMIAHQAKRHAIVAYLATYLARRVEENPEWEFDLHQADKHGETPLYAAAGWDDGPLFTLLCALGNPERDINSKSKVTGSTALHLAVARRSVDITLKLLELGADPNITDRNGYLILSF